MSEWFEILQITAFHHLPLPPGIVKTNLKPLHFFAKLVMKNSSCFLAAFKTTRKKLLLSYSYCCRKKTLALPMEVNFFPQETDPECTISGIIWLTLQDGAQRNSP